MPPKGILESERTKELTKTFQASNFLDNRYASKTTLALNSLLNTLKVLYIILLI